MKAKWERKKKKKRKKKKNIEDQRAVKGIRIEISSTVVEKCSRRDYALQLIIDNKNNWNKKKKELNLKKNKRKETNGIDTLGNCFFRGLINNAVTRSPCGGDKPFANGCSVGKTERRVGVYAQRVYAGCTETVHTLT